MKKTIARVVGSGLILLAMLGVMGGGNAQAAEVCRQLTHTSYFVCYERNGGALSGAKIEAYRSPTFDPSVTAFVGYQKVYGPALYVRGFAIVAVTYCNEDRHKRQVLVAAIVVTGAGTGLNC